MKDEIFSVYGAINDLNERLKGVEKRTFDYTDYSADLLEVGRNIGELHKRIMEIEEKIDRHLEVRQ